jgi:K+-transporting ATPase ATPase A chain
MTPFIHLTTLEGAKQIIAQGPVASQTAISLLGSNGGGFFNANSAHPYANPTPLTNFFEVVAILLLPISLLIAFGQLVGDKRQGWALFAGMAVLFMTLLFLSLTFENVAAPAFDTLNIDQQTSEQNPGGNLEGKELRFGSFDSVLWNVATTGTSNGAVNSMLESAMPLASIIPLFNLLVGCVVFGGVGCGLYSILLYVLLTVFIAGLMVGRTPEYVGKKIEAREMKLAVIATLVAPLCVLIFGVVSLLSPQGAKSITAAAPHGLTQTLYTYASVAAGNGSSFAGFNANTLYQNIALGIVALIGRFGVIIPVLAIAGSLASKKIVPASSGTFPTHGGTFVVLLISVVILFGGLTYFPALALGPIAEHLTLFAPQG